MFVQLSIVASKFPHFAGSLTTSRLAYTQLSVSLTRDGFRMSSNTGQVSSFGINYISYVLYNCFLLYKQMKRGLTSISDVWQTQHFKFSITILILTTFCFQSMKSYLSSSIKHILLYVQFSVKEIKSRLTLQPYLHSNM